MFLQACLNGSRPPGDHEALPLTPEELARDALEVAEAGAVAVHVHPRRARRGRGRALPQAIRLTASSAATL